MIRTTKPTTTNFIEPAWKLVLSNKGILPILWEMYEGHPNLLPSYFGDGANYLYCGYSFVKKPIFSREGANISLYTRGGLDGPYLESPGEYGNGPFIYQGWVDTKVDDKYAVIGSWLVDHESAGMGIRESDGPITDNLSRFVPHVIID